MPRPIQSIGRIKGPFSVRPLRPAGMRRWDEAVGVPLDVAAYTAPQEHPRGQRRRRRGQPARRRHKDPSRTRQARPRPAILPETSRRGSICSYLIQCCRPCRPARSGAESATGHRQVCGSRVASARCRARFNSTPLSWRASQPGWYQALPGEFHADRWPLRRTPRLTSARQRVGLSRLLGGSTHGGIPGCEQPPRETHQDLQSSHCNHPSR